MPFHEDCTPLVKVLSVEISSGLLGSGDPERMELRTLERRAARSCFSSVSGELNEITQAKDFKDTLLVGKDWP